MSSIFRLLFCALLAGSVSSTGAVAAPRQGQLVSAYEVTTLDGRTITSASLAGKVTLVHFWATWCTPCLEEMPALDRFYRDHQKEGFEVIAISVDDANDAPKVREFAKRYAFPIAMKDASRIDAFGRLWAVPLSFLIDPKQIIRKADWTGAEKIDAESLDRLVLHLLPTN